MSCQHYQQLISKFIDRECSAQENVQVKDHLVVCAPCQDLYKSLCQVDNLATSAVYSQFFREDRMQQILAVVGSAPKTSAHSSTRWRRRIIFPVLAVAAGLLILLTGIFEPWKDNPNTVETQDSLAARRLQEWKSAYEQREQQDQQTLKRLNEALLQLQLTRDEPDDNFAMAVHFSNDSHRNTMTPETTLQEANLDDLVFIVYARSEPDANIISWAVENCKAPILGIEVFRADLGYVSPDPAPICITDTWITGNVFADTDIEPQSMYNYEVVLHLENQDPVRSKSMRLKSRNDIRLAFNTWQQKDNGHLLAHITVSKFWQGHWISESFSVHPGDAIGQKIYHLPLQREIDFQTPYTLVDIERGLAESRIRHIQSLQYDTASGHPLLDEKGFYLYESIPQQYAFTNDRIVYVDNQGGKRMTWLHGKTLPEQD